MIFRRRRFRDVIERQLALFAEEEGDLLDDVDSALERYHAADRDEAEELYGDFLLAAEAAAERLAELRDAYSATLAEAEADEYAASLNAEAARRWPSLALALSET